jgi:hypothetical protein
MKYLIVFFLLIFCFHNAFADDDVYISKDEFIIVQKIVNTYYDNVGVSNHKFSYNGTMKSFWDSFLLKSFLHRSQKDGEVSKEMILLISDTDYDLAKAIIFGPGSTKKEEKYGIAILNIETIADLIGFINVKTRELFNNDVYKKNSIDGMIYISQSDDLRFGYSLSSYDDQWDGRVNEVSAYLYVGGIYFFFDENQTKEFSQLLNNGLRTLNSW